MNEPSSRQHSSHRSSLATRKKLLLARAELERSTLAQASAELCVKYRHLSWLKWLLPNRAVKWGKLREILHEYPLLSTVTSLLIAAPGPVKLLGKVKPLIKWGIFGFTAWQGVRLYMSKRNSSDT